VQSRRAPPANGDRLSLDRNRMQRFLKADRSLQPRTEKRWAKGSATRRLAGRRNRLQPRTVPCIRQFDLSGCLHVVS